MSNITTIVFKIILEIRANVKGLGKRNKNINIGKDKTNLPLFADVIVYSLKKSMRIN